ncbi:MAG TPA: hypothetical protein VGN04_06150 [Herbaspirillum sp.]|jgi:hypothetical protein
MENIKLSGASIQQPDPVVGVSSVKISPQSIAPAPNDEAVDTVKISAEGKRLSADEATAPSSRVSGGYATMLKRLFGIDDPNTRAPMETHVNSTTGMMSNLVFLTDSDRNVLANAYQYAADNNIDPVQVDNLASDMGGYRFMTLTGGNVETKDGGLWNTDGSPLYFKMTDQDTKLAKQMLTSQAINSTTMDHGFLAYELNPRGGGWTNSSNTGHATDFAFLQKIISVTSPSARNVSTDSATLDASATSLSLATPYGNALDRINNQDKPLSPPADWVATEAKNSTPEQTVDADDLEKKISALFSNGFIDADLLKSAMALLDAHIKISQDNQPKSVTSRNLSPEVINLLNYLNASRINFSSRMLSNILKSDSNSSN